MNDELRKAHETLIVAQDLVIGLRPVLDGVGTVSSDTWFALGEVVGMIAKAKALIGRDIDHALKLAEPAPS